jgi:predicted enzyme related to lactoylglutathione lyase
MGGVVFAVENCDATFERVRASGAEVIQEPMDQQYGVRDCAFRDPSGNLVRFTRSRSSS